jgi:anaerobic dimethyl sulfoxide reductase subunit C (anchor subunit)
LSVNALRNIGTSWLSREVLFTVLFLISTTGLWIICQFNLAGDTNKTILGLLSSFFGLSTIYCMARIYLLPTQVVWNEPMTVLSFYTSVFVLGSITLPTLMAMDLRFSEMVQSSPMSIRKELFSQTSNWLVAVLVLCGLITFGLVIYQINSMVQLGDTARVSYELLMGLYRPLLILRLGCLALGAAFFVRINREINKRAKQIQDLIGNMYVACLLIIIGEITGRFLFYATHVRIGI